MEKCRSIYYDVKVYFNDFHEYVIFNSFKKQDYSSQIHIALFWK
jgi:hypothetical protein